MTSPRRAERRSISSLISLSVRMTRKTIRREGIFLRIPELVQAVLVDSEVVGELVQDCDPDLLLELLRVGERLDERPAEDRDLVRHVVGGLPEPEQVRIVGILLLDDDSDVLEGPREPGRQRVERPPHMVLEGHGSRSSWFSKLTRAGDRAAGGPGTP